MTKKPAPGSLRFISILFLRFEKGMSKKISPRFLAFVSMSFLIFEQGMDKKNCGRNFKVLKYDLILII